MVIYTCVKRRTESCFSLSCWFWGPGCFLFFCLQSLHFQWNDYCISQLVIRCQSLPPNRSSADVWKLTRVSAFWSVLFWKITLPKSQSDRCEKLSKYLFRFFQHAWSNGLENSLGKKQYPCHRFDAANCGKPMEERCTFRTKSRLDNRRKKEAMNHYRNCLVLSGAACFANFSAKWSRIWWIFPIEVWHSSAVLVPLGTSQFFMQVLPGT